MRLLLLCALLAIAACSTVREPLRLYQRNDGDIINLRVGDVVEVVLDGDPGSEIRWFTTDGRPDLLRQVSDTEYRTDVESNTMERRLMTRFRAVAPGRTRLRLTYSDPSGTGRDRSLAVWVVVSERD